MAKVKRILGIDPGTNLMGFGVIEIQNNSICYIDCGIADMRSEADHLAKLNVIFEFCVNIITKYEPKELSIEAPFYGKNVQSMLKLGRAQGIAMAAAISKDLPVFEYAPRKIKQSISGNGNASKEMVAGMIEQLLQINTGSLKLDATDALAVALCHYLQGGKTNVSGSSKSGNWKQFLKNNPGRIA